MSLPPLPNVGDLDASDPQGFLRQFLARYFTAGWFDSIIRTWVPIALGSGLSWLSLHFEWLGLPGRPSTTFTLTVTALVIAGYYALARLVERKWPKFGKWLVALNLVRTAPVYVTPRAEPGVTAAAALPAEGPPGRHAAAD